MAMNQKLLRPKASGVHPEAAAWRTAVVANGGSVSSTTLAAVNVFCKAVDSAGLRSLFYRLNLFCGGNLSSALVPLYRGPAKTGTQYGDATDTNVNFVSGDYAETGATGGLKGNGTNKRLATGFPSNTVALADRHLAAYESLNATTDYSASVQSYSGAINKHWRLGLWTSSTNYIYSAFTGVGGQPSFIKGTGLIVGQNDSATAGTIYRNGISVANETGGIANAVDTAPVQILGEVSGEFSEARLCGYSIGQKFTGAQVLAYYNAMQAFQTALTRNV